MHVHVVVQIINSANRDGHSRLVMDYMTICWQELGSRPHGKYGPMTKRHCRQQSELGLSQT
jgi:hypothetical protein